jgi:hypothetical protein
MTVAGVFQPPDNQGPDPRVASATIERAGLHVRHATQSSLTRRGKAHDPVPGLERPGYTHTPATRRGRQRIYSVCHYQ